MKRLVWCMVIGGLLGLAVGAYASSVPVLPGEDANNFETITVTTSTAIGLTSSKLVTRGGFGASHGGTQSIFCTVETDSVRFEVDGSSPTATVGHKVAAGDSFQVDGYSAVRNLKFFGSGSVSATTQCTYFLGE